MEVLNKKLRRRILEKGLEQHHGHYGSSMSCLDIVKFLYDEVLERDDIFIMSKGHGAPALHAVLEEKGLPVKWTIHLEHDEKNGVKATTGSLGLGLSIAIGRAFAKKLKDEKGNVYCLVGDGECQEGVVWESLNLAHKFNLTNFILLVDYNKYQAISSIKEIMNEDDESLRNKIEAFGFEVYDIYDGHNIEYLKCINIIQKFFPVEDKIIFRNPKCFLIHTQKGKGIPFLEKNPSFHVLFMNEEPEVYKEAMEMLKDEI